MIDPSYKPLPLGAGLLTVYVFQRDKLLVSNDVPDARLDQPLDFDAIADIQDSSLIPFTLPSINNTLPPLISVMDIAPEMPLPTSLRALPVRQALSLLAGRTSVDGAGFTGRLVRAYHIAQWRRTSVFCGTCGSRNTDAPDELARLCPVCGRREYPRISPAIIILIINDNDQVLLAHNKHFTNGVYSLIAGFNEAGESLEATIVREVREEVAVEVKDIRYITSQPWPFPNSLMLGFTARHAGGAIRVDNVEIEDAGWFSRDTLPKLPDHGSVSRFLINQWLCHE
ncbi:MAG: NAD(+) diphosphatase [Treponema sp.]|jgi:NAD+ diphosphatase|nr:NAD(+) diphosphatase [Treponema sp.]